MFTTKNPHATTLGVNIFNFLLIVELQSCKPEPLLVIADSPELVAQTMDWGKRAGVKIVNLVNLPGRLRRNFKRNTPAGILRASLRTTLLWFLTRRYRPKKDRKNENLMIMTLTHPQSFVGASAYRDVYFGPLVDYVASSGSRAIILGIMVDHQFDQLRFLKTQKFGVPVLPVESFLTFRDILACTVRALRGATRSSEPREPVEINGLYPEKLVTGAIQEARRSGELFTSLLMYYVGRSVASNLVVSKYLYPYENRPWEKMLLLGIGSSSPQTQSVGYQHAAVAPDRINFFLGRGESAVAPLPDSILTTGSITKARLEREGNYPPGMFKTGCALRLSQAVPKAVKTRRNPPNRVLVILATSVEEHVRSMVFVDQAFGPRDGFQIRIRPHPAFHMDAVLKAAPLARYDFFDLSPGSLAEDLEWADLVLYATSTVGLEAVAQGIPAIHLDLGEFVETDPMFGWNEFKWSVEDPSKLVETIREIESLSEAEFLARQKKGREYTDEYLRPVTASALQLFADRV
ncbi:hypothetical protein FIM07_01290 [SAR202 cluster bacterium AD-802-F09_MRT_200m]|nr:hypothetical protein [SAR202 cluster bacterium AD-802-F09_MRT_200m]